MTVHDFTHVAASQFAVVVNLQLVGIDIVDVIAALQVFAEIGESA